MHIEKSSPQRKVRGNVRKSLPKKSKKVILMMTTAWEAISDVVAVYYLKISKLMNVLKRDYEPRDFDASGHQVNSSQ
jgi:hypothetical protein